MISGNYVIANDIFYFQNNIIKFKIKRGDINLEKNAYREYNGVIEIKEDEEMPFYCPSVDINYKRLLYLAKSNSGNSPKNAIILPFFNEN